MPKLAIYCFFILCSADIFAHPFYVSITNINKNPETNRLEITIRLFLDDVERQFEQNLGSKMNLGDSLQKAGAGENLRQYIYRNFTLSAKNKPVYTNFLGFEVEEDIVSS